MPAEANLGEVNPDIAALAAACDAFCASMNTRGHRETGAVPAQRLLVERERLHVLPSAPYAAALDETRLVSTDQTVRSGSAAVAEFWAALAQRWAADRRMGIREFAHAFGYVRDTLAGRGAARAGRPVNPMPMITWDGQVVPVSPDLAGFASPRLGPFTVGNVTDTPLGELLARAAQAPWVAEALAGIAACRASCDHFAYCRGGQGANKYFESGRLDITETNYCRNSRIALMKGLIQHAAHTHA